MPSATTPSIEWVNASDVVSAESLPKDVEDGATDSFDMWSESSGCEPGFNLTGDQGTPSECPSFGSAADDAVTTIQRAYRHYVCRSRLAALRAVHERTIAALIIQTSYRTYQARKDRAHLTRNYSQLQEIMREEDAEAEHFERVDAATTIQRAYRRYTEDQRCRVLRENAAITIQRRFRKIRCERVTAMFKALAAAANAGAAQAPAYSRRQEAAVVIQTTWRCARQRKSFLRQKRAAITIQAWRRYIVADRLSSELRAASHAFDPAPLVATPPCGRKIEEDGVQTCLQHVASVIARAFYKWRASTPRHRAAVIIQAHVRGCQTRKRLGEQMAEIRRRAHNATARWSPDRTLAARTSSALTVLLSHKQLSHVLKACEYLAQATVVSKRCCSRLVTDGAVPVIFGQIRNSNRSAPHIAVMTSALCVISNLANCRATADAVASQPGIFDMIVERLQTFYTNDAVIDLTVGILASLANTATGKPLMMADTAALARLKGVIGLIERKIKNLAKTKRGKSADSGATDGLSRLKLIHTSLTA